LPAEASAVQISGFIVGPALVLLGLAVPKIKRHEFHGAAGGRNQNLECGSLLPLSSVTEDSWITNN
jgi:hypothetical protein